MKKSVAILLLFFVLLSCDKESMFDKQLSPVTVTLNFTHNWDGEPLNDTHFEQFLFTTAHGELINIERLRYVISKIQIDNKPLTYHLVDVGEGTGLTFAIDNVSQGAQSLKFTFGFADEDNLDGIYQDLNSVSFNVPLMLGGGYHYMQFDGKYKDINNEDANFNYHAIRAADRSNPDDLILQDTSFEFDAGNYNITSDTTIEIKMNVAEWFKNPNTWDLNALNTVLMPNFDAQILMHQNGQTVFSVGEITRE